jgi:hypothetical protein
MAATAPGEADGLSIANGLKRDHTKNGLTSDNYYFTTRRDG